MRRCVVSFTDSSGVRHTIELSAGSLYEAAAAGLETFRKAEWNGRPTNGLLEVRTNNGKHTVSLAQLREWADRTSRSPAQKILMNRLKGIL
jgi:hypothetical protein